MSADPVCEMRAAARGKARRRWSQMYAGARNARLRPTTATHQGAGAQRYQPARCRLGDIHVRVGGRGQERGREIEWPLRFRPVGDLDGRIEILRGVQTRL